MTSTAPSLRLAPITSLTLRNPKILLSGPHQPTLLRYLDGWPKRWARPHTFLIRFAPGDDSLKSFATDAFDFAVVQAPQSAQAGSVIAELVRISRQGLILGRWD
jgi:hypothetical protein